MNNRTRALAILNYEPYDRLPLVHFGYWEATLIKWAGEGHITLQEAQAYAYGNAIDVKMNELLGWDFTWNCSFAWNNRLDPELERRILEERPNGSRLIMNEDGVSVVEKTGVTSIPMEVDHLLKGRREWEAIFKPRLQFEPGRIQRGRAKVDGRELQFDQGGRELLLRQDGSHPYGLYCGGLDRRDPGLARTGEHELPAGGRRVALSTKWPRQSANLIYQGTKDAPGDRHPLRLCPLLGGYLL